MEVVADARTMFALLHHDAVTAVCFWGAADCRAGGRRRRLLTGGPPVASAGPSFFFGRVSVLFVGHEIKPVPGELGPGTRQNLII